MKKIIFIYLILVSFGCSAQNDEMKIDVKLMQNEDTTYSYNYKNFRKIRNGHFISYYIKGDYSEIPPEILEFDSLERLIVKYNKNLKTINFTKISQLQKLTSLIIINNENLNKINPDVLNIPSLDQINLSENNLTEFPNSICNLSKLEYLSINKNNIKELPKEIGQLSKLKVLDLSNNQLTEIPEEIGLLENLEELNLYNNPIVKLPESLKNLKKLKVLIISRTSLINFPDFISELSQLEELQITVDNAIIPPSIQNLQELTFFKIEKSYIESISPELSKLKKLTHFNLIDSDVSETKFHDELGELNLFDFGIENSKLREFPSFLTKIDSLKTLSLRGNPDLTKLGEGLSNCENLHLLFVQNNNLRELPKDLGYILKLRNLNIENNRLTTLPVSLMHNHANISISYYGNPWEWLPRELVENFETEESRGLPPVAEIR